MIENIVFEKLFILIEKQSKSISQQRIQLMLNSKQTTFSLNMLQLE